TLTPSAARPYVSGQRVTYTVTAAPRTSTGAVPTGTVTLTFDGTTVATRPLRNGVTAAIPVTLPGTGGHTVTARYHGGGPYAPTSASAPVQVTRGSTTTSL